MDTMLHDTDLSPLPAATRTPRPQVVVVPPNRPPAIDALTSLRGLAALWVVIHHLAPDLYRLLPAARAVEPLIRVGYLAVPFFFMLSGFVLAHNYAPAFRRITVGAYAGFVYRRWLRIYPVHLVTLLAVLAMVLTSRWIGVTINRDDKYPPLDFVLNLFLVQTWVPHYTLNWNGPSWSISSEWFAYLLFPLACVALHRLTQLQRAGLAIAGWLVSVGFYVWWIGMPFTELLSVLPTFLTGCAMAMIVQRRGGPSRLPRYLPDLFVLAIVVTPFLVGANPADDGFQVVIAVLVTCFAATIWCFGNVGNACSRLWRSVPLLYLGEVSYSLYMTHALVLMVAPKLLPSARYAEAGLGVRLLVVAGYAMLFTVATLVSFYLVENPARKHLGRWLARKHTASGGR